MNLTVALTVFAIIFLAALPDKTALASLVLGTRYRPLHVFAGAAAAFAVHVVLAVAAGSLIVQLPHRWLEVIVGALFLLGAVRLLRRRQAHSEEHLAVPEGKRPTFARAASTSFAVILVAEFGDLTQIVTANLAARYDAPVSVGAGALFALWAVAALAIVGGRGLLRLIPITVITRAAARVMIVLAAVSLFSAVHVHVPAGLPAASSHLP